MNNFKKIFALLFLVAVFALPVLAETKILTMQDYTKFVKNTVLKNINKNVKIGKKETVNLTFFVNKEGDIDSIRVKSSEVINSNKEVIEAVKNSSPLGEFPVEVDYLGLTFRYNITKNDYTEEIFKDYNYPDLSIESQYREKVRNLIIKNFPTAYMFNEKNVIFKITVNNKGFIEDVKILKSSGSDSYDKKVVHKVKTTRCPNFPEEIFEDSITLKFNIEKRRKPSFVPGAFRI